MKTEMMNLWNMWKMEKQGLLDKLRKVEEELVMLKGENKQLKKLLVEPDRLEGGGEGSIDQASSLC